MSEFTKGPLLPARVLDDDDIDQIDSYDIVDTTCLQIIGRAYSSVPPGIITPAEANAWLWSAAPDLYEACRFAMEHIERLYSAEPTNQDIRHTYEVLIAALAKAEGQPATPDPRCTCIHHAGDSDKCAAHGEVTR